ncbi:MAG: SURF1 family protein [Xanthobacteraceae bacterium]
MSAPAKATRTKKRRSWLGLLIPALLVFAALMALGTWQLERKTWKEGLIAALTERLAAPPVALPAPATWPRLDQARDEYRRVKFAAAFDHDKEALVYAAASSFRPDVAGAGPGYWIFTPARLPDGGTVIVNRGFVPEARKDAASRAAGQIAGAVEIVGTMRWPDARHWFSAADDPLHNLWFTRDPLAIAAAKGLNQGLASVAPFYVEQESPAPPGGLPQPGKLVVQLRNEHLQYAVTWYGLALVLVVVFVVWARSSFRDAGKARGPGIHNHEG